MRKFPVWIIPFTLLFFIFGVMFWLYASGRIPFEFGQKNKLQFEKATHDNQKSLKNKKDLKNRHQKKYYASKINTKKISLEKYFYQDALQYFEKGDYQNASLKFIKYLHQSKSKKYKIRAKTYLAFSLLFFGMRSDKTEMLESSQKRFLELYREIPVSHKLSSKIILGLARSSRLLESYPEGIDILLKQHLIRSRRRIQKHIYLELGYFYFTADKIEKALLYFKKSGLPIANKKLFNLLLEKEGTAVYLLNLLQRKMIPRMKEKEIKIKIQKKVLLEAKRFFNDEKKEEAYYLLKRLIVDFPNDFIVEEANFYLGDFYLKDLQFQKALYFFNHVLSNEFMDLDAASLFKKAIIYNRTGNKNEAIKNFNLIRENFVSSKYYRPAIDWLKELKTSETKKEKPVLKVKEKKIETKKKTKKNSELLEDDLFLKEEIPKDEIY